MIDQYSFKAMFLKITHVVPGLIVWLVVDVELVVLEVGLGVGLTVTVIVDIVPDVRSPVAAERMYISTYPNNSNKVTYYQLSQRHLHLRLQ